ncbi:MAG: DUF1707 SHOCT-like domain-containing protein [Propionibacteriaceae bacterium]
MSEQERSSASKDLRPSTAEREPYVDALAEAHADGRLDAEEYWSRLGDVEAATTGHALDQIVDDVPFHLHEQRAERATRVSRRKAVAGLGLFLALGGGSYALTRAWLEDRSEKAAPGPDASSPSAAPESATTPDTIETPEPGSVPTTMVQVPLFDAQTLPKAMDHCISIGIVQIRDIAVWDPWVQVNGRTKDGELRRVEYHTDRAPSQGEHTESGPWLEAAELRDLDLADLVRRSRDIADLGGGDEELRATIRHWQETWSIEIRGSSEEVHWDITGQNQLDL